MCRTQRGDLDVAATPLKKNNANLCANGRGSERPICPAHRPGVGPCTMCRWLIYFGDDVLAYDLLYRTANALIGHQSEDPNVREQIIRAR